jgi:hypothetical protein
MTIDLERLPKVWRSFMYTKTKIVANYNTMIVRQEAYTKLCTRIVNIEAHKYTFRS